MRPLQEAGTVRRGLISEVVQPGDAGIMLQIWAAARL